MKHIKLFENVFSGSMNTGSGMGLVTFEFFNGDHNLRDEADIWSQMAEIAPDCVVQEVNKANFIYEITVKGPLSQCQKIADYWNAVIGAEEIMVTPL